MIAAGRGPRSYAAFPVLLRHRIRGLLSLTAFPPFGDPAASNIQQGAAVGFVGVELNTRCRNRLTGRIREVNADGFVVAVDQSFGNCPQYIQAREPDRESKRASASSTRRMGSHLDEESRALISRSDTLFIASASPSAGSNDPVEGADVNHRGGRLGFVRVEHLSDGDVLTFPDFVGNLAFNTLGNITLNPVAELLFVDFETGDLVTMTCRADIIWNGSDLADFRGAERLLRLTVEEAYFIERAISWSWSRPEQAPQLAGTGSWEVVDAARQARSNAARERPFRIVGVKEESPTVRSIFLAPSDGAGLAAYDVGQHLSIAVPVGDGGKSRRNYSLSREPGYDEYRISVRRAIPGKDRRSVSNWLHDSARVGNEVGVRGPQGAFKLDADSKRSVVLIAGGIGITPLLAMAQFLTGGTQTRLRFPDRAVRMIHAVANGADHPFREEVAELAASRPNLSASFVYRRPLSSDQPGTDYQAEGRLNKDLLRALLPLDDYDSYICGPPNLVQVVYDSLLMLGLSDERIHFESFGSETVKRSIAPPTAKRASAEQPGVDGAKIAFARSKLAATWHTNSSLLELAESTGIDVPWSCRSGRCGTCLTGISGG